MSEAVKPTSRLDDLKVLWHLLFRPVRGKTHGERLESFYEGQASHYDSFRAKLLHGRSELMSWVDFPDDGVWVDFGAGTGHNLFSVEEQSKSLSEVHLVDLSQSLLKVASERIEDHELKNVTLHHADATKFELPENSVDVVTFSYSLTMIPDWFESVLIARRILKPGGTIAVTDFHVSRKHAASGRRQHGWLRRTFWSLWFASDNVYLSSDHLAMLNRQFETERCDERLGSVPYMPLIKAPYYLFLGRKPAN
ncbi:class I SAM-dependent methyltransferase [Rhodopirellula bahusiensis]|uniref:SAM-dependent methyltransferase n=1 Tax=Rhodopirellula bahusiensis TaxID=2014065 RepID=A0A2G1WD21_9BACT|nr:class I SAM-dependent methyltransferase [Rhodopirellula bahusiensis]PHQ36933.1 SAM-dependent methyltransferase [Rhodopirellula bahusiensis]